MLSGNSIEHLSYFINKLNKNEPFALIRPADGEFEVVEGRALTNIDNWTFNGGSLQSDLLNAIINMGKSENGYVGLACKKCCGEAIHSYCLNKYEINKERLTYANIFCNRNWKTFISYLKESNKEIYYIGPGKEVTSEINVIDRNVIDEFLVNRWDAERETFMKNIAEWVGNKLSDDSNKLFCLSAGPIAKILITKLNALYPFATFLDVGSTFDLFLKGKTNRSYIDDADYYTKIICNFETGHSISI
jgi:hypothetical protein